MLDKLLDYLDPYIAEIILGLFMTYGGWLLRFFVRTPEAKANFERAVASSVDYVTDEIARLGRGILPPVEAEDLLQAAIDKATGYVRQSVPDSIKFRKISPDQIANRVTAEIKGRIAWLRQNH